METGRVGVFYATRHGHARRVAEHVAEYFRTHGLEADIWSVLHVPASFDVGRYAAIVVTASVHAGRHEPEMVRFVREHRRALSETRNAFITLTLSQAGAERADASPAERAKAAADVARMTRQFIDETGWTPERVQPVAGALAYTRYNFVQRLLMKWIAGKAGGSTDTSKDHVYTDWSALNALAAGLADEVRQ